ncbi:hypothetical protein EYF80_001810 [Liparis tanakae]|uniref:Uncharacterized protein n=1 Tax=Liparis tanakae TaxID=230148 RepID=A0A4Z2JCB5_9TELE|nr:hypothetical protein EYF80_001810 [Liparis tanakae]
MMSGRINIFSILIRMSPGKAITMTISGWIGEATRSNIPNTHPRITPEVEGRGVFVSRANSGSGPDSPGQALHPNWQGREKEGGGSNGRGYEAITLKAEAFSDCSPRHTMPKGLSVSEGSAERTAVRDRSASQTKRRASLFVKSEELRSSNDPTE